jgi:hypothetical protein
MSGAQHLQVWVDEHVRRLANGTVNGMKDEVDPDFTMRKFVERAVRAYALILAYQHRGGESWPEADSLDRRGRGDGRGRTAA